MYGNRAVNYQVIYLAGDVWILTYYYEDLSLENAQAIATTLYPDDAVLLNAYYVEPTLYAEIYQSDSLTGRFGGSAGAWLGAAPGTFNVSYQLDPQTGLVDAITVGCGDNP